MASAAGSAHCVGPEVDRAYDYRRAFDFDQKPLAGIKTTTQPVSDREKARLHHLAQTLEDEAS